MSEAAPKSRKKKRLLFAAKAVISIAILAFVLQQADLTEVWERMRSADMRFTGLALLTPFLGYAITSTRWQGLLLAAGTRVPFGRLYRACMTAVFFNQILPSTVGGDVARIYAAWKSGATKSVAVASLLVDRVVGVMAQVLIAAAVMPFLVASTLPDATAWLVLGLAVGVGGAVLAVFLPENRLTVLAMRIAGRLPGPLAGIARKLDAAFAPYRGRWGVLARALVISVGMIGNVVLMHWLIGRALGLGLPVSVYFFVIPLATVVMLVPISINGIGIREGIFALLLGGYGVAQADAVALSLLAFATFFTHGVLGGLVFAFTRAKPVELSAEAFADPAPTGMEPR